MREGTRLIKDFTCAHVHSDWFKSNCITDGWAHAKPEITFCHTTLAHAHPAHNSHLPSQLLRRPFIHVHSNTNMGQLAEQYFLKSGELGSREKFQEEIEHEKNQGLQNFTADTIEAIEGSFRLSGRLQLVVGLSPRLTQQRLAEIVDALAGTTSVNNNAHVPNDEFYILSIANNGVVVQSWRFEINRRSATLKEYLSKVVLRTFVQMGEAHFGAQSVSWLSTSVIIVLALGTKFPESTPYFAALLSVLTGIKNAVDGMSATPVMGAAASALVATRGNLVGSHIASGIALDQRWNGVSVTPSITFVIVACYGAVVQFFEFWTRNHITLQNAKTHISSLP